MANELILGSVLVCVFLCSGISAFNVRRADLENEVLLDEERSKHPDVGLRVPELVAKYGYPIESHTVITKDRYILTVHRIPHGKNNADEKNKPVVFLQHGLLCSSADWVLMGPEKGLAYILADRGYDVWMGNARGNTYSRKHEKYNPDIDKEQFWNFSWHEIGVDDLPTMIDRVLEVTKVPKVYYIGHSQGTTVFWVMTSERPEYNDKIRLMSALAPVSYMNNIPNKPMKFIAKFHTILSWVIKMLGQYEFLPSTTFMQLIGQALCNDEAVFKKLCDNILFLIAGFDEPQLNQTMVPVILSNTPAGASTKQFLHFSQLINSKKFQKFDYGSKINQEIYGQRTPPEYDLKKITAPVSMYYGQNDLLTSPDDILKLHQELPHSVRVLKIKYPLFSHLDFLWSTDVIKLLYNDVITFMKRF